MKVIAFVSCVSMKQTTPQPIAAKDLYISPLFKKAREYVEKVSNKWYILSAYYGLLGPEQLVSDYNLTLNEMSSKEVEKWSRLVYSDIIKYVNPSPEDVLLFLAGMKYRKFLIPMLRDKDGLIVNVPMKDLPIGKQLSWLNHELELMRNM